MSISPGLAPPPVLDVSSPPPTVPIPIVPPSSDSPPPTPSTPPPLPLSPPIQPPIPPLPLSPPTQPPIPSLPTPPPIPPLPLSPPIQPPTQPPIPPPPRSPPTQSPLPVLAPPPANPASPPLIQSPPVPSPFPPPPSPSLPPPTPSLPAPSPSPPNPSVPPPSISPPAPSLSPPSTPSEPPSPSTSSSPPPAPLLAPPPPVSSPPPPPQIPPLPPPFSQSPSPPFVSPPVSYSPPPLRSKSVKSPPSLPSSLTIPPPPPSLSRTGLIVGVAIGGVAVLAVFVLLWLLFTRKKRKQDHGTEGYIMPRDTYNGGPAQPGHQSYSLSGEQFPLPNPSTAPPVVATLSTSYSAGPSQPLSMNGNGGLWSNGSGYDNSVPPSTPGLVFGGTTTSFTYEELTIATNGFSTHNLLGQGGFGYVHKGVLPNGKIVAVKSLKADSGQGDREFQAEVETISRVHHKHLVSLVGYCIAGSQKLLVYEFVENQTFEFHMHGKGQPVMNWETRLKIAIGAAKGLAYLHEDCHPKVIHRDIKAANILLDFNYEAMVADFGLAKFSSDADTHISTRVMGTFGYLAPEYAASGKLTEKSDIFSFGVVLLELITGRRPVDYMVHSEMEDSLVDWARPLFSTALRDGNFDSLVDPRLEKKYNFEEMGCMITCAASSVRHSAKLRPRMSQIVRALEGNLSLSELNDGVKPGFSSVQSSIDIDNDHHMEDVLRFRSLNYQNGGNSSSQFGTTTSKYGP